MSYLVHIKADPVLTLKSNLIVYPGNVRAMFFNTFGKWMKKMMPVQHLIKQKFVKGWFNWTIGKGVDVS